MASWAGGYGAGGAAQGLQQLLENRILQQKQAEMERAQRAQEQMQQAELAQRSEQFRASQGQHFAELAASRDENYQDRVERRGAGEAAAARQLFEDTRHTQERGEDAASDVAKQLADEKYRTSERKGRESFESMMASRESGGRQQGYQWVNRGGQPVYTNQVQAGDTPQSTREQGRPVGTSDANRIADFDTSLDDLATLKGTLPKGSTGPLAQAAAAVPNWAAGTAETMSLGMLPVADAKKKDAVISRVKQVIGKAFEGGVLRKEDEAKYEKILPNVSDSDEMVASKLAGLDAAIQQRRGTLLENLGSAGYDVTHFSTDRKGRSTAAGDTVPMTTPDGRSINVPTAMVAEAEKRGAKR